MYLKMHYYIYNKIFLYIFLCFHNYISKKCIARRAIFSFSVTYAGVLICRKLELFVHLQE